jgi:hypothetical protein
MEANQISSRCPTLLQLCLKAIIANKLHEQTACDMFVKMEQEQKYTVLKWEYEKLSKELPLLLKSNEIHHELEKLEQQRELIKRLTNKRHNLYTGIVYGGCVRDYFCSGTRNLPHDIDMMFNNENDLNEYIAKLLEIYQVEICDNITSTINNSNPANICPHCTLKSTITLNKYADKYDNSSIVKTIRVTDSKTNASIHLDLTVHTGRIVKDFDVNTLEMRYDRIKTSLRSISKQTIFEHIAKKQFVVLTNSGLYREKHHVREFNRSKFDIQYTEYNCDGDCICRHSSKGKKIQERIGKMQKRGWSVLNSPCENPLCILSPDELYQQYLKEMTTIQYLVEQKKAEKQKKKHFVQQKKMNRIEIVQLEKQINFATEKDFSTRKYEKRSVNKQPCFIYKSDYRNYRKDIINKKIVCYDSTDLIEDTDHYQDEEEM